MNAWHSTNALLAHPLPATTEEGGAQEEDRAQEEVSASAASLAVASVWGARRRLRVEGRAKGGVQLSPCPFARVPVLLHPKTKQVKTRPDQGLFSPPRSRCTVSHLRPPRILQFLSWHDARLCSVEKKKRERTQDKAVRIGTRGRGFIRVICVMDGTGKDEFEMKRTEDGCRPGEEGKAHDAQL